MRERTQASSIFAIGGVVAFILAISLPLIAAIIEPDAEYSNREKRPLSQLPDWPETFEELSDYPEKFNQYYADQFGFRVALNRAYLDVMSIVSPKNPLKDVTRGKDGWLFLGSPKPHLRAQGNPFGDARHTDLYNAESLSLAALRIKQRSDWLRAQGIEYVYTIAPNKHTIYFDKLPEHITKEGPLSSTDQLFHYLRQHTDVAVVDLRAPLFQMKQRAPVYYKYDTHWNMLGANIAQHAIMQTVNKLLPESFPATQLPNDRFDFRQINKPGDLSIMAQLDDATDTHPLPRFSGTCLPIHRETQQDKAEARVITTCNTGKLTMLMYRDSSGTALIEYLSKQFEIATYVWQRTDLPSLREEIAKIKPNVVIELVTERHLPYVPVALDF